MILCYPRREVGARDEGLIRQQDFHCDILHEIFGGWAVSGKAQCPDPHFRQKAGEPILKFMRC
jgi:hypothetical protein